MTGAELRDAILALTAQIAKKSTSPSVDGWAAEIDALAKQITGLATTTVNERRKAGSERRIGGDTPMSNMLRMTQRRKGLNVAVQPILPTVDSVIATTPTALNMQHPLSVQAAAFAARPNGGQILGKVLIWASSNGAAATVDQSGNITTVATGTTSVTASCEGKSVTFTVSVTSPVDTVLSVTISPLAPSVLVGGTQPMTFIAWSGLSGTGNQIQGQTATWSATDATKASIDSSTGIVTGVATGGTPQVRATVAGVQSPLSSVTVSVPNVENPDLPVGFTNVANRDFNTKAASNGDRGTGSFPNKTGGSEGMDGIEYQYGGLTIQTDATAPLSPSNVMRMRYLAGDYNSPPGTTYSPGLFQHQSFSNATVYGGLAGSYKQLYLRTAFKLSANFQGHNTGTNKLIFVRANGAVRVEPIIRLKGVGAGALRLSVDPQGSGEPDGTFYYQNANPTAEDVTRDVWHKLHALFVMGTKGAHDGSFQIWYDDVLSLNYSGIEWYKSTASAGMIWDALHVNPTWGGQGGIITSTMDLFFDRIAVWCKV